MRQKLSLEEFMDKVKAAVVGHAVAEAAGAFYGYDAIPEERREPLLKRNYIEPFCDRAFKTDDI